MFGGDDSTTERKPAADVANLLDMPLNDAVALPIDAGVLAREDADLPV
jgi:hypothetical protein